MVVFGSEVQLSVLVKLLTSPASSTTQTLHVLLDQQNETKNEPKDTKYGDQSHVVIQKGLETNKADDKHGHRQQPHLCPCSHWSSPATDYALAV
jgi:phosphohistidine phosphatase SixA